MRDEDVAVHVSAIFRPAADYPLVKSKASGAAIPGGGVPSRCGVPVLCNEQYGLGTQPRLVLATSGHASAFHDMIDGIM